MQPSSPPGPSHPTVLLRHVLPDGSAHFDWLLARDPTGERALLTFRVPQRVDLARPGEWLALERIADHRPRYLSYEGPIDDGPIRGGRGTVTRVASGAVLLGAAWLAGDVDGKPGALGLRWDRRSDAALQWVSLGRDASTAAWQFAGLAGPPLERVDERGNG